MIVGQLSLWKWGSIHSKQVLVKKQRAETLLLYRPSMLWKFRWGRNDEIVAQLLSNCYFAFDERYDREVEKYHLCSNFPSSISKRLDEWWSEVLPSLDCSTFVHAHQICCLYSLYLWLNNHLGNENFCYNSHITIAIDLRIHYFNFCAKRTSKRIKILEM